MSFSLVWPQTHANTNRGYIYAGKGAVENAMADFEAARELTPKADTIRYQRAVAVA